MPKFKPLPPLEELKKEYTYNPETGVFKHAYTKSGMALEGATAGSVNRHGYVVLWCKGVPYQAHRLAWLWGHGIDPSDNLVDHKDQDKTNNRLSNLRLGDYYSNAWNTTAKGWQKRGNRFRARIWAEGKLLHLGTYATAEEAQAAYQAKAVELRGDYAPETYSKQ